MSSSHIIKLVAGIDNLDDFYAIQQMEIIDYHGQLAVPCWTRYKPKQAEDILRDGGSIYRVLKNRIQCRHKILGFEMVETTHNGTRCMIVQSAEMIQTVSTPRRPFQGWRYLKPTDIPRDIGPYIPGTKNSIPPEMEQDLKDAGLF